MAFGTSRIARRIGAIVAGVLLAAFASCVGTDRARAIEVGCIEASKYKYLYQIFGDDRRRFAEYFQLKSAQLPDPEACRAIALWGHIEPSKRDEGETDFDKLFDFIAAQRGWLSTIYLASSGGNIGMGFRLSELTRMFWLKTYAIENNMIDYVPDFFGPAVPGTSDAGSRGTDVPPELSGGWRAYVQSTEKNRHLTLEKNGRGRCASACTFVHVGGIDRQGVAYFHRGRLSAKPGKGGGLDTERSMADAQDSLQKTELRVLDLYRQMDGGDEIITLFKETSTLTVAPAVIPRSPRYVSDLLRARCRGDILHPPPGRRDEVAQCVAAAHEKERLQQFARYCAHGCDRSAVQRAVADKIKTLAPETRPNLRPEADDPRRRGRW